MPISGKVIVAGGCDVRATKRPFQILSPCKTITGTWVEPEDASAILAFEFSVKGIKNI